MRNDKKIFRENAKLWKGRAKSHGKPTFLESGWKRAQGLVENKTSGLSLVDILEGEMGNLWHKKKPIINSVGW